MTITDADPATMSIDQLAEAVARGTAEQAAYMAWWLSLVAEFHRRDGHHAFAMASCAHWLAWRCGIDPRTAREHVRVADKLVDLPLVRAELAAGRLSYSKVRAVTRVAEPNNESLLVDLAATLSASQLERVVKHYEAQITERLNQQDDDLRRAGCGVTRWVDSAGLVHHEIVSAPEEAGLIDAALSFGADSLFAAARAQPAQGDAGAARGWLRRRSRRRRPARRRPANSSTPCCSSCAGA